MSPTKRWLVIVFVLLMAATLSCGLFGKGDEMLEAAAPDQPAENNPEPERVSPPQGEAQPPAANEAPNPGVPQANLGDEYRSEAGGYAFRVIPNYEVEEIFGFASMTAPDADPEKGPLFLLIGDTNDEPTTADDMLLDFTENADSEDITILEQREITVDGSPGILVEVKGTENGETVRIRAAFIAVNEMQVFSIIASAPPEQWDEIADNFDPVLNSVSFFEPQEMSMEDLDDMFNETSEDPPDEGDTGEYDFSNLEDLSNFPSAYSDLPPGGFAILLAGEDMQMLTVISGEQVQTQTSGGENILTLAGEHGNELTLYLPDIQTEEMLIMTPYDPNAATHAPGATIRLESTLYTSIDGIIMIEAANGNTISGSFFFAALDEIGKEFSVSGFFNELPLTP